MRSIIDSIVPSDVSSAVADWQTEGEGQRRITLLHKDNDRMYCFLSYNMQEVKPDEKIDMGMTISLSKGRVDVNAHYDPVFHQRDLQRGHYFTFEQDSLRDEREMVIPFRYDCELPSAIVDSKLQRKVTDLMEFKAKGMFEGFERIEEEGILRALYKDGFSRQSKERKKQSRALKDSLRRNIEFLFHEHSSPSVFIQKSEYQKRDRGLKTMFLRKDSLLSLIKFLPLVAAMPQEGINRALQIGFVDPYRSRFGESREDETERLLSEFAGGHPKVIGGAQRVIRGFKHFGNLSLYSLQAGLTATYALNASSDSGFNSFMVPTVMGITALSGATILGNAIVSRGRNSSGVVSTLLDRALYKKLA